MIAAAKLVVFEKVGESRRGTITLQKGTRIELTDKGTMVAQTDVLIDVTEVYDYSDAKNKHGLAWRVKAYFTDSVRLPPPTRWQRFKAWITRRPLPTLPKATVVERTP